MDGYPGLGEYLGVDGYPGLGGIRSSLQTQTRIDSSDCITIILNFTLAIHYSR